MNVFLVIPTLTIGGAERVMSEIANKLSDYPNLEVHLVLLAQSEVQYSLSSSVVVHNLFFKPNSGFITKIYGHFRNFLYLKKLHKFYNPKFVLSFMNKYNVFVLVSLFFESDANVYVSERDNPYENIPVLTKLLRRFFYRYAKGVICQTEVAKKVFSQEIKNNNYSVIPNPVRNITDMGIVKENLIVSVGRLTQKKGQSYLIELAKQLNNDNWKIVVVGDGPLKEHLVSEAKIQGVSDKISFVGESLDVDYWLKRSSIFVFPSLWEGFPNALAEAMISGLPVVSFDCPTGPSDLIQDGVNGFLVPLHSIKEMSAKVNLLINDHDLRIKIGSNAMLLKEKLNSEVVVKKFYDFCIGRVSS